MTSPESDALDPSTRVLTFEDGSQVKVLDIRLRALMKCLKIITRGAGPLLFDPRMQLTGTSTEIAVKFMTILGFAVPEAEDEAIEFILSVIEPVGLVKGRKLTNQEKENNSRLLEELVTEWDDPDPLKAITVLEAVVHAEKEDLAGLVKKLMTMFKMGKKTGLIDQDIPISMEESTSETSAEDSI